MTVANKLVYYRRCRFSHAASQRSTKRLLNAREWLRRDTSMGSTEKKKGNFLLLYFNMYNRSLFRSPLLLRLSSLLLLIHSLCSSLSCYCVSLLLFYSLTRRERKSVVACVRQVDWRVVDSQLLTLTPPPPPPPLISSSSSATSSSSSSSPSFCSFVHCKTLHVHIYRGNDAARSCGIIIRA